MDPLSDVLSLLKPRSYRFGDFEVGGDWSIRFPRHEGIKCYAIGSGQCWLAVEGVDVAPVRLQRDDYFLLPWRQPFRVASDLALPPVDAMTIFPSPRSGGIALLNGGDEFSILGEHFMLDGSHARVLLRSLPPIVISGRIRAALEHGAAGVGVARAPTGGFLVGQHLAYMMLIQALRLHLAEGPQAGVGWLLALAERRIGAAINAMHDDPAQRWTLQELAGQAGMSRSSFALRFKETVGEAPMEYLTRWRMLLAGAG